MAPKPDVTAFFDEATNTVSYVVKDPRPGACAVIDSVLDFDCAAGRISPTRPTRSSPMSATAASTSSG